MTPKLLMQKATHEAMRRVAPATVDVELLLNCIAESVEVGQLFAIRRRGTSDYLLARNRLRGGSIEEPLPWPGTKNRVPRTFGSVASARKALTAWCKGEWIQTPGGYTGGEGFEYNGPETIIKPGTARNRADMEIVEFTLTVKELHG